MRAMCGALIPSAGDWTWTARLIGPEGELPLDRTSGSFSVKTPTPILRKDGRYLRFSNGDRFLKGGTNSPENLLGYVDLDGTYRSDTQMRSGESNATDTVLHSYSPHISDWNTGDPVWQDGKGKGLIGAINYLSDQGLNAAYFLTFNVGGDGKDVWPFVSHEDFTRFDVSKLDGSRCRDACGFAGNGE